MKQEVFETETVYNTSFFISTFLELINFALIILIIYFIVKLYRKLVKFLDKNS